MKKNVASQVIGAQMVAAADGSAFTGSVTVSVTGDAGTQATGSVGSGACTHEGNGFHTYAPAQAETNYDHIAFTFTGSGAIPATVQVYTNFPQAGDNFSRLGAPAGASVSADIAAVKAETASIQSDTNDIQTRLPAALVSGRMDSSVGAMAANVLTATAINADAITAAKIADGAIDAATFAAGAINAAAIASDAITDAKVASDVTIASVTGSVGSVASGGITSGSFASGAITAAAIAADAIGASELAADAVAEIQSGLATASALSTVNGLVDDLETRLTATRAGYLDNLSVGAVATASALSTVSGKIDTLDDFVDTEVAAIKTVTDKVNDTLENDGGTYRFTTNALEQAPTGGSAPTAAAIADAVWDEAISGHVGSGSTGEALAAAGGAGDPWITTLPGGYSAGQAGYILGTNLNATVSSRATQTSVDDLPTNAELGTALGTADDAVLARLGTPAGASIAADIAAVQSDTDNIQTRIPTALVSGRMDASVGAMAANVMTAAAAASDLTTELQTGLATSSSISTLQTSVDDLPTNAELASALETADDAVLARLGTPAGASVSADIAAVKAQTNTIATDKTGYRLSSTGVDDILDEVVEGSVTLRQSTRLANAALGGKASGLETTEATYRDLGDTKDRIVATVDADGNRTVVTRDLS